MSITGVVLAAGAGARMGRPKALLSTPDGASWVRVASELLLDAGCERVVVVLGASASSVIMPTDASITSVVNADWASGMASSLRVGLAAATGQSALVTVVDMPELPVAVVRRVIASGAPLARAVFDGRPGHPVLIAAEHWAPIAASVSGDYGARTYLDAHGVLDVECGDLYDGHDIDR
ncbi:CTP:molybdopterin cytidylyltransferase MocA [Conyzicola nivalis]|uniref:CTP:molybdopterin cytidylyltransferase MocA n=1 Tax=Conyzicola nivalis TaxID=1477021 RepID=A0ABV2QST6_9MICO